jgi:hypothetical protein
VRILRATATFATWRPRRLEIRSKASRSGPPPRAACWAASTSAQRSAALLAQAPLGALVALLGQELAERGITASSYPQTDQRAIPASARLHDAIVRQKLVLPSDPELRRHAANAVARSKPRGWRIEAPDRSSNVDGVVALMMALDRFENQPQPARLVGWL